MPSCSTERETNDSSVRGQDCGIPVAEPLEQLRRVLDVGEDERHRPSRQLGHAAIVLRDSDSTLSRQSSTHPLGDAHLRPWAIAETTRRRPWSDDE